jgi:hypothetical protein
MDKKDSYLQDLYTLWMPYSDNVGILICIEISMIFMFSSSETMTASPNVPMTTAPPLSSSGGSGPSSLSPGNQPTFGSMGGTIPQPQGLPTPPIQGLPIQSGTPQGIPSGPPSHSGDMRYSGTELVMLYDYKVASPTWCKILNI